MIYADEIQPEFGIQWPRFELKDYSKVSDSEIAKDYELKTKIEELAADDPIQYGWILETWQEVMDCWKVYKIHVALGGNRATKTKFGARLFIDLMEKIPECRIRAFTVNEEKSINEQQSYVWEALPEKYKSLERKHRSAYAVSYTQSNGFVNGKLILPPQEGYRRGSEMLFGNYQQYRNDPQVVEGWWAHAIWCDEECPQKMFERLLTRLYDAHGRILLTFTTIGGWSPLVADILGRTKILRKRFSDLLNCQIPVAQESLTRPGARIYFFWTQDNPFIPADTTDNMKGRPEAEIKAVAHGIPTRSATTKFPKFSEDVHVIKHEDLPWEKAASEGKEIPDRTNYQILDPAGSKPWFFGYAAVMADDTIYIYREWPDVSYGNWGEPSEKPEGTPGPAQKPNGFGIGDYCEVFKNLEEGEVMFDRLMDPRMGAAVIQGKEGATSIQSELDEAGYIFRMAPGLGIDHGISLINDKLSYDEKKDVSSLNHPKIFISDRCENIISCLKNYTGCSRTEVWKEGVDILRYLLEDGADYIDSSNTSVESGRTFSY